ncbi:hypothetical protein ACH9L7_20380 (plasmid) [Haloferax sp. S1W]|uniref:hypothetical protein n=1 Tax=Haloferax sp. S1W TaxID=3377110 RepID=UPI0037C65380
MSKRLKAAQKRVKRLLGDRRAQSSGAAGQAANVVVSILVASLMAAYLLPMAINEIIGVDTTSWTGGASALWEIIPVMIVLAIFIFFVNMALSTGERL